MDWLLYEENIVTSNVKKIHFTTTTMQTKLMLHFYTSENIRIPGACLFFVWFKSRILDWNWLRNCGQYNIKVKLVMKLWAKNYFQLKKGNLKGLWLLLVIVMRTLPNSLQLKKKSFPTTFFVYKKSLMPTNL